MTLLFRPIQCQACGPTDSTQMLTITGRQTALASAYSRPETGRPGRPSSNVKVSGGGPSTSSGRTGFYRSWCPPQADRTTPAGCGIDFKVEDGSGGCGPRNISPLQSLQVGDVALVLVELSDDLPEHRPHRHFRPLLSRHIAIVICAETP